MQSLANFSIKLKDAPKCHKQHPIGALTAADQNKIHIKYVTYAVHKCLMGPLQKLPCIQEKYIVFGQISFHLLFMNT